MGDMVGYSCCHWVESESYDVHVWLSGFWAGEPREVLVRCTY